MNISELKNVGPKKASALEKLGLYTIQDLISYYPFRYDVIKRSDISTLSQDDKVIIDGTIESNPTIYFFNKKMNKMTFKINTGKYLINVSIFNRGYLKSKIIINNIVTIIGKYDKMHNLIVANDIKFSPLDDEPRIEPIYHSSNLITSNQIKELINEAIKLKIKIVEYIPEYLKLKYKLINKDIAIKQIHNPKTTYELNQALAYLKYEELFLFMLKMNSLKLSRKKQVGLKRTIDTKSVKKFINDLPFTLTIDQEKCVNDILSDITNPIRMNRLIQGDVGSGKTMVAIIALYINYLSGYQGVMMAPTEVLANQHYLNISKLLNKYGIKVDLLTGSMKLKEKKDIYNRLNDGNIDILIGTHALFSEGVTYNNLGLVITDEQHRFGVNQRSNLKNKGVTPDVLYLSATPIPRTYALTIYGDMDVSNIKTLPNGRKEIKTLLMNSKQIKSVLEMMYNELKNKHQIYVIAPLVEESDKIDLENVDELYNKMNSAFGKVCKIGIMHGKMDKDDKEDVMQKFKDGEISILVSTTVIEVGVDVKNATMIVIFDAFRFGLSQLHQLRGRVGRNSLDSYCILISDKDSARLNIMTKTLDGFKISEEDFKIRGSGDLFGVRQSGDMSFKVANLKEDFNILLKAKDDSLELLSSINNYPELKKILDKSVSLD